MWQELWDTMIDKTLRLFQINPFSLEVQEQEGHEAVKVRLKHSVCKVLVSFYVQYLSLLYPLLSLLSCQVVWLQ